MSNNKQNKSQAQAQAPSEYKPPKTNYTNSKSPLANKKLETHNVERPKSPLITNTNPNNQYANTNNSNLKLDTGDLVVNEDHNQKPIEKNKGYLHNSAYQNYNEDLSNKKRYSNIHLKNKDITRLEALNGYINKPKQENKPSIRTQKNNLISALDNISNELKPLVKNNHSKVTNLNSNINKINNNAPTPYIEQSSSGRNKQKIELNSILADLNKQHLSEFDEYDGDHNIKSSLVSKSLINN